MKTDRYRLKRIVAVGDQLLNVISLRDLTPETLLSDIQMQWMVTTPLYNIGEQANCISREFADAHPEVPFAQIAGLRHRLFMIMKESTGRSSPLFCSMSWRRLWLKREILLPSWTRGRVVPRTDFRRKTLPAKSRHWLLVAI